MARAQEDSELKEDLLAYYKAHPNEKMGTIAGEEMVFRYRTVEAFLASGTPLTVCDIFRPLLERVGITLTNSSHLRVFIPKIEAAEMTLLNREILEQYISISFDGTFRLGEAINITGRWCSTDFHLCLRLLDFSTLAVHADKVGHPPL